MDTPNCRNAQDVRDSGTVRVCPVFRDTGNCPLCPAPGCDDPTLWAYEDMFDQETDDYCLVSQQLHQTGQEWPP